jgi:hypothetical protein
MGNISDVCSGDGPLKMLMNEYGDKIGQFIAI